MRVLWENISLILIAVICFSNLVCAKEALVETTHGKVLGKVLKTLFEEKEYYGFMGIPFAAPPVKNLRFVPPRPIEPWSDILRATKEKPACVQYNNNVKKGRILGQYGVEDCLYLDIFTPTLHKKYPVIVFLHNEHFSYTNNKTKDYAPDFFIENYVVIATISHRLSVFGFLSFEDDVLSGNSGLKDIVAGLEWIQNNIERFGGDPDRITLMGSQGGAAAVDMLIHTKARNLFNAAILQGETAFLSTYLQEDIRNRAFKLSKILDRGSRSSNRVLKDLNEVTPGDLLRHELEAIPQDYGKEHQRGLLAFGPIVEKDSDGLLTRYPEDVSKIDIPVMIGSNSRDGLEKSLQYLIEPNFIGSLNKDFPLILPVRVNYRFNLDNLYDKALEEIKHVYFPNGISISDIPKYVTYMGDINNYAIDHTARFYSGINANKVFYYHFDYYSDFNENKNEILRLSKVQDGTHGAASGDELCYLFKCPSLKEKYLKHNNLMSEEIIIQKKMLELWTNFAKYGNPSPDEAAEESFKWPPYSTDTKQYLSIEKDIKVKTDLCKQRFGFWEKFLAKWGEMALDGFVSAERRINDEL